MALVSGLGTTSLGAQAVCSFSGQLDQRIENLVTWSSGDVPPSNCNDSVRTRVYQPTAGGVSYELSPSGCDPQTTTCSVRARVGVTAPGNSQNNQTLDSIVKVFWRNSSSTVVGSCGSLGAAIGSDQLDMVMTIGGFECGGSLGSLAGTYTAEIQHSRCFNATPVWTDSTTYELTQPLLESVFCQPQKEPYEPPCELCAGGNGGSGAGASSAVPGSGGGGSCPLKLAGRGPGATPPDQPGVVMRYQGGGAGASGQPFTSDWRSHLGRGWSHEFATRIFEDPDESAVLLVTESGTYRRFTDLESGSGLLRYQAVEPADEYRTLSYDTTSGTWQLAGLDGSVAYYDSAGLWDRTEDRNQNTWEAVSYSGTRVTEVSLPDGQTDLLTYVAGRLRKVIRRGTDGTSTRVWTYTFSGPDLARIEYPDGRALIIDYNNELGLISRMSLMADNDGNPATPAVNGATRILRSWEYDASGNVVQIWSGTTSFSDANVADNWSVSFDDPDDPTEAVVTDPLGGTSTYTFEFDSAAGGKPRILSIDGSCPTTCGTGPDSTFEYDDPAHPLLPTTITDGNGTETVYSYDARGRIESRTDAANVSGHPHLPRVTEWLYDSSFPAFPIEIAGPTKVGETHSRKVSLAYDSTTGNLESRTIEGDEATYSGGAFALTTEYPDYNSAGMPETIDPPGYSSDDQTTYTYSVPDTNGMIPDTRTDPLVGTWEFGYDAFNRRTSVEDPNAVVTDTTYDTLGRVTQVIRRGATSGDDLVTSYFYNNLGDLHCTKMPTGNGIQYLYGDPAGRMTEMRRGTAVASPSGTACLTINSSNPVERKLWDLDEAGHRINEKLERSTNGTSWTTHAETDYVYSTTCHLDQVIQAPGQSEESVTEYAYDCNGNLEKVWDPNHLRDTFPTQPSTEYAYDELDRLGTVTQPWGGSGGGTVVTSYEYDVQDHLVEVTDGEGTVTSYVYSDRDLMTSQVSEVSGTTTYSYNDHGELVSETDARSITVDRTVDAADRVTLVDYPDTDLDVTYTWGTSAGSFDKGRLVSIENSSSLIEYTYDRFGRVLQDGALTYEYDKNGNRTSILYPDGVLEAIYTFDRMDREASLSIQESGGSPVPIILGSSPAVTYRAYGPLESFRFRINSTTQRDEVRSFDRRFQPTRIEARATGGSPTHHLDWFYSTDAVGNVTAIDDQVQSSGWDRSFDYQDWQYFLTGATGPWLGPLAWSYDRSGNRLSETRNSVSDDYSYLANGASTGNTALLHEIELAGGGGGTHAYSFDSAGYLNEVDTGSDVFEFVFDAAGRMVEPDKDVSVLYDGQDLALSVEGESVFYDSSGRLAGFGNDSSSAFSFVVYFSGRPVALWSQITNMFPPPPATILFVTTDHLGTSIHAYDATGATEWQGGFEPFGRDFQDGTSGDAFDRGIFLRLPGQWITESLDQVSGPVSLYQNAFRWYEPATGRYTSDEPLRLFAENYYTYAVNNPLSFSDRLGLAPEGAVLCGSSAADTSVPSIQLPPCCTGQQTGPRLSQVGRLRQLYCANTDKPQVTPKPKAGRRLGQIGGIDDPDGQRVSWIVPVPGDNDCTKFCRCLHELIHVRELGAAGPTTVHNSNHRECNGYSAEEACLKRGTP
jgi:RHS repeat-associated protein